MFTGLITHIGKITQIRKSGRTLSLSIQFMKPVRKLQLGESIAVNGVCLTAARLLRGGFEADVVAETLKVTTLGQSRTGEKVHLERALAFQDRFGGHFVSGHVDGKGKVIRLTSEGRGKRLVVEVPAALQRYCVVKGSIAINGVSLTLQHVQGRRITLALVPHTLKVTLFKTLKKGQAVNVEADIPERRGKALPETLVYPSRRQLGVQLSALAFQGF